MHRKVRPSSNGLLRALQALAEESTLLDLKHTHLALQHAIETCLVEVGEPGSASPPSLAAGAVH